MDYRKSSFNHVLMKYYSSKKVSLEFIKQNTQESFHIEKSMSFFILIGKKENMTTMNIAKMDHFLCD